jgi:nucleoside-diphosphate-sugar epimerase
MSGRRRAAVTGASGYLGSRICTALESEGWEVIRLIRSPAEGQPRAYTYELDQDVSLEIRELLTSTDLLVHAAYDLRLTRAADVWRVNVEGTRRLLDVARDAQVRRVLVLSSMSAYEGTTQLYGRAKLAIEAISQKSGGCAVRPGLVYGAGSGGMAGALRKLTHLPLVPLISGDPRLYTAREDELLAAITRLAALDALPVGLISVADPVPVRLRDLMTALAGQEGRRCRFVTIPSRVVYMLLRSAEAVGLHPPFRSDSLLGLVRAAPGVVNTDKLAELGVIVRASTLPNQSA